MGKILVGCDRVEQHICKDENTIYLNRSMILTCGAKDYLRNKGVAIVYGEQPETPAPEIPATGKEHGTPKESMLWSEGDCHEMEKLMQAIITILKNDHQITDMEKLKDLSLKIITQINSNQK